MKKLNKITFWIFTALTIIFWGQGASSFLESFELGEIANSIISLSWGVLTAIWVKALVITLKPSDEDEYSNSDSGITTFTPEYLETPELDESRNLTERLASLEGYKLARKIDDSISIYVKPKAWFIPNFLYKLVIKDSVAVIIEK